MVIMRACAALVLFVVALWLSVAEGASGCSSVETVNNFNKEKFFREAWYITHYKLGEGELQEIDKNCTKLLHQKTGDKIREVFSNYNPSAGTYSYDISFVKVKDFDGNSGKYTATNVIVDKEGTKIDERKLQVSHIDTDYENYSVVYVCDTSAPDFYLYTVQSRKKNVDDVKVKVEAALRKVNLQLSNLFDATTLSCQYDDDTLNKLLAKQFSDYEK